MSDEPLRLMRPEYSPPMARFLESCAGKDGCWVCSFGSCGNGYAEVWADTPVGERNRDYAHHAAYICIHGSIPEGMHIMHTCDVRRCCKPGHLVADTQLENNQDCKRKGRNQHGAAHWNSKITEADVLAIRADTRPLKEISRDFGIGIPAASMIRRGRTWKHVSQPSKDTQ